MTEHKQTGVAYVFLFATLGVALGIVSAVWMLLELPERAGALSPGWRGLLVTGAFAGVPVPFILVGLWLRRRAIRASSEKPTR